MTVRDAVGSHETVLCKGADGVWRERPRVIGGRDDATAFRGRIGYSGQYAGQTSRRGRSRELDLRNLQRSLRQAIDQANRSRGEKIAGPITITLDFTGTSVTGSYSGASRIQGRLAGTVVGGVCRLADTRTGAVLAGPCGPTGFSGRLDSAPDADPQVQIRFETTAGTTIDFDVRDRKVRAPNAEAEEQRRRATEDAARRLAGIRASADAGDVDAMTSLAQMYSTGDGVARNYAEAFRWYRLAAARGSIFAMHNLGVLHWNGEGVERNRAEGHRWFLRCAETTRDRIGNACAATVAENFETGTGVVRDDVQAVRWYRTCAAADNEACIAWPNDHGVGMAPPPKRPGRK